MPHHKHVIAFADQLAQRRRHNTGAHLTALFHALGDAAVKRKAVLRALRCLVAAAAERHVERLPCCHLRLAEVVAAADADGQSDPPVVAGGQLAHAIQDVEFARHDLLIIALLQHGEETVIVIFLQYPVPLGCPVLQKRLHASGDLRPLAAAAVLGQLLQIVYVDKQEDGAGLRICLCHRLPLGNIHIIQRIHSGALCLHAADIHRIAALLIRDIHHGFLRKLRNRTAACHRFHRFAEHFVFRQHPLEKQVVIPQYLTGVGDNGDRHGKGDQGIPLALVQMVSDRVQQPADMVF